MKDTLYIREWLKKGDKTHAGFVTLELEYHESDDSYISGGLRIGDGDNSIYFSLYNDKEDDEFEEGSRHRFFDGSLEKLETMIKVLKKAHKFIKLHS